MSPPTRCTVRRSSLQVFSASVAAVSVSGSGGLVALSDFHAGSTGSQSFVGGNGKGRITRRTYHQAMSIFPSFYCRDTSWPSH